MGVVYDFKIPDSIYSALFPCHRVGNLWNGFWSFLSPKQ